MKRIELKETHFLIGEKPYVSLAIVFEKTRTHGGQDYNILFLALENLNCANVDVRDFIDLEMILDASFLEFERSYDSNIFVLEFLFPDSEFLQILQNCIDLT